MAPLLHRAAIISNLVRFTLVNMADIYHPQTTTSAHPSVSRVLESTVTRRLLPSPKRRYSPPPRRFFGPCLWWPNGWMDQDATGCEVGLGPGHIVLHGAQLTPQFSADVYCGQMVPYLSYCWALVIYSALYNVQSIKHHTQCCWITKSRQ